MSPNFNDIVLCRGNGRVRDKSALKRKIRGVRINFRIPYFFAKIYWTIYIFYGKIWKRKEVVTLGSKYTKAQREATKKYMKGKKGLHVVVSEKRHREIKDHAFNMNESLNAFISRAIDETMERDKGE